MAHVSMPSAWQAGWMGSRSLPETPRSLRIVDPPQRPFGSEHEGFVGQQLSVKGTGEWRLVALTVSAGMLGRAFCEPPIGH
jgi:hypothetical protein